MSTPGVGHNSGDDVLDKTAQQEVKSLVERIERLIEERSEINEHLKEVRAEAKGRGFDPQALMAMVRARAKDRGKALERRAILELYASALGDVTLADLA